jgi:hypothetical protein
MPAQAGIQQGASATKKKKLDATPLSSPSHSRCSWGELASGMTPSLGDKPLFSTIFWLLIQFKNPLTPHYVKKLSKY